MIIPKGEEDGFAFVVTVAASALTAFRGIAGSLSQEEQKKKKIVKKLPRRSEQLCTGGHTTNDGETMIIIDGTHRNNNTNAPYFLYRYNNNTRVHL